MSKADKQKHARSVVRLDEASSATTLPEAVAPSPEHSSDPSSGSEAFPIRDVLLFPDERPIAPFETRTIVVVPETRSLVQRIVMHRSIAARLVLVQMLVGESPRTRAGSGSCEIFLFDVPNWAPGKMVITPEEPLRIVVRNMLDQPLKSAGSVIVGVSSLPSFEVYRARSKLFGGHGGHGGHGGDGA